MRRDPADGVKQVYLTVRPPCVAGQQVRDHVLWRGPRAKPGHSLHGIHRVDQRLRRQRADPALDVDRQGAHGEESCRDGGPKFAGGGIAGQDGPSHR